MKHDAIEKYVERGFHAGWGSGGALDDLALIERVTRESGLDWPAFSSWVDTEEAQSAFRSELDAAIARGVFGVPIMTVGKELWFGNDRLFMLDEYLAQVS